jgi:citrate lyase subunit beta/citryl-CoA lyase
MRSLLFVPADSDRKLAKSFGSGADGLILDLEDSVASDRKPAAREMAKAFLAETRQKASRPRLYVRINSIQSGHWTADLAGVMAAAPDGIVLPKPRSGDDVHRVSVALDHAEERAGLQSGSTRIIAIATEVPVSILVMHTYIDSTVRLEGLTWGAEDLSAEIGASATRETDGRFTSPFALARSLCLFTASAAGVQPIDTVYINLRNAAELAAECAAAARDGFTGKLAIHPDQVEIINRAFTPSPDDIARAQEIVRLFAEAPGAGVISLAGQMVDRPHLTRAERLLARAALATPS